MYACGVRVSMWRGFVGSWELGTEELYRTNMVLDGVEGQMDEMLGRGGCGGVAWAVGPCLEVGVSLALLGARGR